MFAILIMVIPWTLTIGVCAFAWWKGGVPERWGGTLNLFTSIFALAAHSLPVDSRDTALLIADGLLAFGLLLLAVRYASLWIGAAMMLQAIQFILHAYYFVMEVGHNRLFAIVNDLVTLGILTCIFTGTVATWRKGARAAAAAAASS
jgi:hypothetical protein